MRLEHILFLSLTLLLTSCKKEFEFNLITPKVVKLNSKFNPSVLEKNNLPVDSISYFFNGSPIKPNETKKIEISTTGLKLGKQTLTAIVYYDSKSKKIKKQFYLMADTPPKIYTYKILNTYPHDKTAFTQGLEFHNGYLYESTGQNGASTIRKVELKTGKILKQVKLDDTYFGEGMTILNDNLFMLTWKSNVGFIYDVNTFELKKTFKYNKSPEGWGLANNGKQLIKTDGSERIWFLNSETQSEESYIEAYTNKRKVEKINELEFIDGKIYANIWQQNAILIINPSNGKIEGIANLNGLKEKVTQYQNTDVLNGIAYDTENKKIYVTGKNWDKLFEIQLITK